MVEVIVLFIISCGASIVGAITGIGGGIIIKPVVDATGLLAPDVINFLSGCTVMSMSAVSLWRNIRSGLRVDSNRTFYLAGGAALGGVVGKFVFQTMLAGFDNTTSVTVWQNVIILLLTAVVLWYVLQKHKLKSYNIKNCAVIVLIGGFLGIMSSFLGIGGGPINIMVLALLFSMEGKEITVNSILVILFSQVSSLIYSFCIGIPNFKISWLLVMVFGGVAGGIIGSGVLRRLSVKNMEVVFHILLVIIICICIFNIVK